MKNSLRTFFRKGKTKTICVIEALPSGGFRKTIFDLYEEKKLGAPTSREFTDIAALADVWEKRSGGWEVVVSAAPGASASVSIPVRLHRERATAPVQELEIENAMDERLGIMFNQCRERASAHLKVPQADTVLVDSRVGFFHIDGHEVTDPVGFPGRSIESAIELTFVPRRLYEDMGFFFEKGYEFYFTDHGRAGIYALYRILEKPCALLCVDGDRGYAYVGKHEDARSEKRESQIAWGTNDLANALASSWGVERGTAFQLYMEYRRGEVSPAVKRHFDTLFKGPIRKLFNIIEKLGHTGDMFLVSSTPLPVSLPKRIRKTTLRHAPLRALLSDAGFSFDVNFWADESTLFLAIAPYFEYYFENRSEGPVGKWLRRRLHWLGALAYEGRDMRRDVVPHVE